MSNKIKIGLDVHGVIDTFPEKYLKLVFAFDPDSIEVHIITGIKRELDDTPVLQFNMDENKQLPYSSWFSIHQECEDRGIHIEFDAKGRPLVDPEIWDKMKAEYCAKNNIDFMFDDSPSYGKHFNGSTVYLQQKTPHRDDWRQNPKLG